MAAHAARPVVKLYLLPDNWEERQFQTCCTRLAGNLKLVEGLRIEGYDDFLILFPSDRMKWGTGKDMHIEVDLPKNLLQTTRKRDLEDATARTVVETMQEFLPEANIQCKVYWYDPDEGFWSTKRK